MKVMLKLPSVEQIRRDVDWLTQKYWRLLVTVDGWYQSDPDDPNDYKAASTAYLDKAFPGLNGLRATYDLAALQDTRAQANTEGSVSDGA